VPVELGGELPRSSFYFGMAVGAEKHAFLGFSSHCGDGTGEPRESKPERFLAGIQMMELERGETPVVAADFAGALVD